MPDKDTLTTFKNLKQFEILLQLGVVYLKNDDCKMKLVNNSKYSLNNYFSQSKSKGKVEPPQYNQSWVNFDQRQR